jgi:hypothetical protein
MNVIAFTTSYWHNEEMGRVAARSLAHWRDTMDRLFHPTYMFVACGTNSNPAWCRVERVPVINSGVDYTRNYDVFFWQYAACAFTAAMAHALTIPDWDFIVEFDANAVLGNINLRALAEQFMDRPEILMGPPWHRSPDTVLSFWKREAAVRYLHNRVRGNLIVPYDGGTKPILFEHELAEIYKGLWFCPWKYPDLWIVRQCHGTPEARPDAYVKDWPVVESPSPAIRELFEKSRAQIPL